MIGGRQWGWCISTAPCRRTRRSRLLSDAEYAGAINTNPGRAMLAGTRSFSSFDHPGCKAEIPGAPKGYVVQVVGLNVAGGHPPHKPLCPLPRGEGCWYIRDHGFHASPIHSQLTQRLCSSLSALPNRRGAVRALPGGPGPPISERADLAQHHLAHQFGCPGGAHSRIRGCGRGKG